MTTDADLQMQIRALIRQMRQELIWKSGAAARHLLKRKLRGHLAMDSSLSDYEVLIRGLLQDDNAEIYVYYADDTPYLAVAALSDERRWLVISSFSGIMETAFVVENPEAYLSRPMFHLIGRMAEVMR